MATGEWKSAEAAGAKQSSDRRGRQNDGQNGRHREDMLVLSHAHFPQTAAHWNPNGQVRCAHADAETGTETCLVRIGRTVAIAAVEVALREEKAATNLSSESR
jgi:hypothetical protein